jgi:hypothetical protein
VKLGIMQPYFFPYLGYFDLIRNTDRWIVFDTAQYIRHGWVNRNRILHPTQGWQYIIAPLQKHSHADRIQDVAVHADSAWRGRILGQIQHYSRRAPCYAQTRSLVEDCLAERESSLSRLNVAILARICRLLGIAFEYEFFSDMRLELDPVEGPGDWALRISQALCATEYVNPPGGDTIFDRDKFEQAGIRLTLRKLPRMEYATPGYAFEPDLSIIDLLMWNESAAIKRYLDAHCDL